MHRIDGIYVISEYGVLDIHGIMRGLAKKRPIFHSEADFQFALAWQIRETILDSEVRLEWKPFADENLHIDIWLRSHGVAIELKYPTETVSIEHEVEQFELKESGLHAKGFYDCVKDIARLEQTVAKRSDVQLGIFVLLTNRPRFWKKSSRKAKPKDAAFRLHEGRKLAGELTYANNELEPINLKGTYNLKWCDYHDLDDGRNSRFRYLAVEVGKSK